MKTKQSLSEARAVADALVAELAPLCDKIEVAGSIRRGKVEVGDLEIVAIPKPIVDLFGTPTRRTLIDDWLADQHIMPAKNGAKYKQLVYRGFQVDLFLATPDNWGLIFMLRTGPAEFSRAMVTLTAWGGYKPANLTVSGGQVWRGGSPLSVPDERTLFSFYGMAYIPPELRGVVEVQHA